MTKLETRDELAKLLRPFELLLNQCEAEFTVDGDWSNDGQAITGQTFRACRRNLPLLIAALTSAPVAGGWRPTDEQVECAARAIYEKRRELLGLTSKIWDWDQWDGSHTFYRELARAALALTPTPPGVE